MAISRCGRRDLAKRSAQYSLAPFLDTDFLLLPLCCLITGFQSVGAVEVVTANSLECQCDVEAANGKGDQANPPFP